MSKQSVTIDTNILTELESLKIFSKYFLFHVTSVTEREVNGTQVVKELPKSDGRILETAVWGESDFGNSVWGGDGVIGLEEILKIISSGSFPKPGNRESLTVAERKQLRDAMILEAHYRDKRDIFISGDEKAFIKHNKRDMLQDLLKTKIFSLSEFKEYARSFSSHNTG